MGNSCNHFRGRCDRRDGKSIGSFNRWNSNWFSPIFDFVGMAHRYKYSHFLSDGSHTIVETLWVAWKDVNAVRNQRKSTIELMRSSQLPILGIILIILPFILPYKALATNIIIYGLLAMALNILLGFVGLLSFCHAALFGTGAYVMGLLLVNLKVHLLVGLLVSSAAGGLVALLIGIPVIQRVGVYFGLLTLAFNQIAYFVIYGLRNITGGDSGLRGVFRPDLNLGLFTVSLGTELRFYYFVLFWFLVAAYLIKRMADSSFGKVLLGIKENEMRMEAVGCNVKKFKLMAFVLSGIFAALAGAIYAIYVKFVSIDIVGFIMSGEIVMMVLLGGVSSFYGPLVGSAIFTLFPEVLSSFWERWMLIMGIVFILFVMFFREGICGGLGDLFGKFAGKKGTVKRDF
jgi:branched-chain amino acid transport system permease protein